MDTFEAILELNKAIVKSDLYTISRLVSWNEDGKDMEGTLNLSIGSGYFSGSMLSITGFDNSPSQGIKRVIDRPIEINARMFVDGTVPSPTDHWVISEKS